MMLHNNKVLVCLSNSTPKMRFPLGSLLILVSVEKDESIFINHALMYFLIAFLEKVFYRSGRS